MFSDYKPSECVIDDIERGACNWIRALSLAQSLYLDVRCHRGFWEVFRAGKWHQLGIVNYYGDYNQLAQNLNEYCDAQAVQRRRGSP